jgi:hypothetical protein
MRSFNTLSEREILALAISLEEGMHAAIRQVPEDVPQLTGQPLVPQALSPTDLRAKGPVRQEVDSRSSVQVTAGSAFVEMLRYGKNRYVLSLRRRLRRLAIRDVVRGRNRDDFRDNRGDSGVPATRSLAYT